MTTLAIFSSSERQRFDYPPKYTAEERVLYFSLTAQEIEIIDGLRSETTKIGFVLQLGYFKSQAKFYLADRFLRPDIEFVKKMLGFTSGSIDFSFYQNKIVRNHRKIILSLLGWCSFDAPQKEKLQSHIQWLVQRQLSLKPLFFSGVDFCWKNKIEVPFYNILVDIISREYDLFEENLTCILSKRLTKIHMEMLDKMLTSNEETSQKAPLSLLKQVSHSMKPSDIQQTVVSFQEYKKYFKEFELIINELNLSDQATEYFATWIKKSRRFQVTSLLKTNQYKLYLQLLCYIKHQFYFRHDCLMDIFLISVRVSINAANKRQDESEKVTRSERNHAIRACSTSNKSMRDLLDSIVNTVHSPTLSDTGKVDKIKELVTKQQLELGEPEKEQLELLDHILDTSGKETAFFDALEQASLKLQNRVSDILKVLEMNTDTSSEHLIKAIEYFRSTDGNLGKNTPTEFLPSDERKAVYTEEKLRTSVYKVLLFSHVANGIKSGHLNLRYSYRYKSINEYLITKELWDNQRDQLIQNAGLTEFLPFQTVIEKLKKQMNDKYILTNENFLNKKNSFLTKNKKNNLKIQTPKIESSEDEHVSSLLLKAGPISVLQVLYEINQVTQFSDAFKHFSLKHKKLKPSLETIFAGILGNGCNIGMRRLARISSGISEDSLRNVVNWFFILKNLQEANNRILSVTNKLPLSNHYRHTQGQLHTSSDGQKMNVSVDSLHASYSFKYFGKGKGVTAYTFIDERMALFHHTIFSSSEREAAYVIDGLEQNEVIKSDIHSTDTHGFTETIFAATHFIGVAFAPRIKGVTKQNLYSFGHKKSYENKGYEVLPSRTINLKLIETHWSDILRFMATIRLKYSSASLLFKRLSSYAKDHPLYQAIKEFGRIIKSIFILTYLDDVEIRQRIEKQLNKVELANKFSKAVFFDRNQEFKYGSKEEQEIAMACKVLIQNAIVLWNYLYLSTLLANNHDLDERSQMVLSIKRGSIMAWQHFNFHGEYDFTKISANDSHFELDKLLALKFG